MHSPPASSPRLSTLRLALIGAALAMPLLAGCAVVAVTSAALGVVATGVGVAAKTAGAAVDLAIPDGDDDEEDE